MTRYKHLFQRSIAAAPDRLHFAAHSHHLWPDASFVGHHASWQDAARLADRKWDRVMGEIWPAAQAHVAAELALPHRMKKQPFQDAVMNMDQLQNNVRQARAEADQQPDGDNQNEGMQMAAAGSDEKKAWRAMSQS